MCRKFANISKNNFHIITISDLISFRLFLKKISYLMILHAIDYKISLSSNKNDDQIVKHGMQKCIYIYIEITPFLQT